MAAEAPMRVAATAAPPGQALRRMLERGMSDYTFDADRFARTLAANGRVEALVLAYPAVNTPDPDMPFAERVRALVADASYQLK
jgi:hypothetical protein